MEKGHAEQSGKPRLSPSDRRRGMPPGSPGAGAPGMVPQGEPAASAPPSPSRYPSPNPGQQSTPSAKRTQFRNRSIASCLECRRRKIGCDKTNPYPCGNCVKFSRECVYLSATLDEKSQIKLTEFKEKSRSLDRTLERDVARSRPPGAAGHQSFVVDQIEDEAFGELESWPSDAVSRDVAYDDDNTEGAEALLDQGVQIGRMRLTDRVGGLARPRLTEEMMAATRGVYGGVLPSADMSTDTLTKGFMQPVPTPLQPSSGLMLGQPAHPPVPLDMLLPAKAISDGLMAQYFQCVHPVARCLHGPSFQVKYQAFWDEIHSNVTPRPSTQALIFAVMFSAAVSLDDKAAVQRFGYSRDALLHNFKTGAESALCQASFLQSTKVETLQALIIYLIPLCRTEVSRALTVLVGAAIRLAESVGLHRDGETFGFNPRDTHVRRLLWHQLCLLDVRTAEAHGPRPFIRRGDYDTRLPLNCAEEDIHPDGPPPEPQDHWTPMTFSIIRFEVNEVMKTIWVDRRKLENRQALLTEVLSKTEDLRKLILEKYEAMLQDDDAYQRYTKLVMHLLLYKLYAMLLHPYHSSNLELPQRLNNVLVMAGVMMIEISIRLENDTLFGDWSWYFGTYSQHQVALLLAAEIQLRPTNRHAGRVWSCLDYVFLLDRNLPPEIKLKRIFEEVWMRTAVFRGLRKLPGESASGTGGRGQFEQERRSVSPGRRGGKSPEHKHRRQSPDHRRTASQHLHPYYRSPGPSAATPAPADIPMLMGQYGVIEPSSTGADPIVQSAAHQTSDWVENVDWEAVNALFPADPTTGEVNLDGYHDPSISMNWQQWQDWT